MKQLKKRKLYFLCIITALLSVFSINSAAFSAEKPAITKSIDQINDNSFRNPATIIPAAYTGKLSSFVKTNEIINLESDIAFFPKNLTIDITLRDVDIASILRIIAREGHKNIIVDRSVTGNISAELNKISLNEAMQVILTSEELEARLSNGTIFVASRPVMAKKGLNRRCIKTFKLNNSNPVEVAGI